MVPWIFAAMVYVYVDAADKLEFKTAECTPFCR